MLRIPVEERLQARAALALAQGADELFGYERPLPPGEPEEV